MDFGEFLSIVWTALSLDNIVIWICHYASYPRIHFFKKAVAIPKHLQMLLCQSDYFSWIRNEEWSMFLQNYVLYILQCSLNKPRTDLTSFSSPLFFSLFCKSSLSVYIYIYIYIYKLKIKSVAYSSQRSHTGQLDFCNWLAESSLTG